MPQHMGSTWLSCKHWGKKAKAAPLGQKQFHAFEEMSQIQELEKE